MSIKRLNKNDIIRGRIIDQIAELFGNSVLGVYDKKLRVELIDDDGNVIQFSIAPVVHKDLVDQDECDKYVTTDEKIKIYEEGLKKNDEKTVSKKKKVPTSKTTAKESAERIAEVVQAAKATCEPDLEQTPYSPSDEDQQKLDSLMAELGL